MATIVNYEIYYYDVDRGDWTLQARYPGDEKDKAIDEAKVLEFSQGLPVKVLRDAYNTQTNTSDEGAIYVGRIKPSEARARAEARRAKRLEARRLAPGGGGIPLDANGLRSAAPNKAKATADFAFRLIMVMIAALTIAILGTGVISMLSAKLFLSIGIDGGAQSLIMFLIFMGLFLMTAVPLVMLYVPLDSILGTSQASRSQDSPLPPPPAETAKPKDASASKAATTQSPDAAVEAAVAAVEADRQQESPPGKEAKTPAEEAKDGNAAKQKKAEQKKKQKEREAAQAEADAKGQSAAETPATTPETPAEPEEEASPALEHSRLMMMKFLGGAVSAIKQIRPKLDAYNKFGINLYFTGACEALAEAKRLTDKERQILIREAVEVIGTRPEHAKQLIERMDTYRSQVRYRQMIAAGKVAMEVQLSGSSDPFIAIGGVIKDWNTPQAQQVAANTVTILFTDMVGSTDITHMIGDAAAQDIIRAHNHIVRSALLRHNGKEVKHTGDGIMASFDSAADAVTAAIEIQEKAAEHTEKWPKQPLELRIGMNTGEPIVEENDYFGATVQVAARVCATAGSGQVWLSADTYDGLPLSVRETIFDHGQQHLKGVQGETGLYEVAWTEARRQDLAVLAAERAAAMTDDATPASGTEDTPPSGQDAPPSGTGTTATAPPQVATAKPDQAHMPPPPQPSAPTASTKDA